MNLRSPAPRAASARPAPAAAADVIRDRVLPLVWLAASTLVIAWFGGPACRSGADNTVDILYRGDASRKKEF
jgi:hypothetical protein